MTPLRQIVRKELREAWRQPGSLAVIGCTVALLGASVMPGVVRYRDAERWKGDATARPFGNSG